MTICVRCSNIFEQESHPLAHYSTICTICKKQSLETIYDQQKYNEIMWWRRTNEPKDR